MANTTQDASPGRNSNEAPGFFERFLLFGAPRELWMIFSIHLVGYVSYMIMNWTFVLWLSSDLGYSDAKAGLWVALWSALMTLVTVFVGSLTDAIGIRKALLLSMVICIIARVFMAFASAKWMALGLGMIPVAVGEALGTPAMVAATRRYSMTAQRSVAFSYFYASMNVGILISGFLFDYIRRRVGEPVGQWNLPLFDIRLTTYQTVFLVSLIFQCGLFPILYWGMREGVEATDEGVKITPGQSKYPHESFLRALGFSLRDTYRETVRIFLGLFSQPGFHKFLGFLALAAMVRLIFVHMNYTYPKFGIRELGPGAPVGTLYNINAFMIIFLVPVVGVLSRKVSAYKMVAVGSTIAAASVFIMTVPSRWFQPLADGRLGHLIANSWLGGDEKLTVDDICDLPALVRKLNEPSDPVSVAISDSLSHETKLLMARELTPAGFRNTAPYPRPGSGLFMKGDLRDCVGFAARLRTDAATQPVSNYIWSQLSPGERKALTNPAAQPRDHERLMLAFLNRLLQDSALGKDDRFAGVGLSDATQGLLKIDKKAEKASPLAQTVVQNRLLLEDAYPEHIARSGHAVRVALAYDLTRLIQEKTIYDANLFSGVVLSAPVKAWLTTNSAEKSIKTPPRINRYLLEDVYPTEIARNRIGVPGSVNPYYIAIVLFVVLLSFGEAIYSPRLYEYAAAIAPKGQEGSYMSLSYLPFFLAKLTVASFSGVLLGNFCPETGPRSSGTLWLIIALTTTICPLGLIAFRRWIRVKEAGRDD